MALVFGLAVGSAGQAQAEAIRILALGDSLTAGLGLSEADAFTTQLEAALKAQGYDVRVLNAGVSGDTTAGGLDRLDWALADKPDLALVELGANDMLRGVDPTAVRANLDKILARLGDAKIPTLLAGMLAAPNLGPAYGAAFDAIYPDLAKAHGVPLYPFFLDGVAAQAALNQADGMHPNAAGVKVIVDRITPAVVSLIKAGGFAKTG
ncbi:arylesterase [Inquilinus sp. 2KB_12]|uniref:Acyl-CoA thioesterase-1 n=1 Tax=Inquilinus ginsengisoli TaxID=363840 RepID=A0ABU1JTK9_9PROT|nr:arylesterase [Inquilinus ginsengisoli]MDR6291952.1 acyl-CoA thioesterase-1 [Inquilinus ginsengisoli]